MGASKIKVQQPQRLGAVKQQSKLFGEGSTAMPGRRTGEHTSQGRVNIGGQAELHQEAPQGVLRSAVFPPSTGEPQVGLK